MDRLICGISKKMKKIYNKTQNCNIRIRESDLGIGIAKFDCDISLQLILEPHSLCTHEQTVRNTFSASDEISHPKYSPFLGLRLPYLKVVRLHYITRRCTS